MKRVWIIICAVLLVGCGTEVEVLNQKVTWISKPVMDIAVCYEYYIEEQEVSHPISTKQLYDAFPNVKSLLQGYELSEQNSSAFDTQTYGTVYSIYVKAKRSDQEITLEILHQESTEVRYWLKEYHKNITESKLYAYESKHRIIAYGFYHNYVYKLTLNDVSKENAEELLQVIFT